MADTAAETLLERANAAFRLATSRPVEGRQAAEAVAKEAESSDDPHHLEAQVIALRGASWAARELFDHAAAHMLIDKAVSIAEYHDLPHRLSECYLTRSSVHLEHGHQREAQADLAKAAAIAPPEVGAEIAVGSGIIEQKAGMYVAALASYRRGLSLASDHDDDVRFKALSNGAMCASRLNRHDEARRMIDEAIAVAGRTSAVYAAHSAHNRAVLTAERGHPTQALDFFDEALRLVNAANLVPAEHYLEKAETFLALRLLEEANIAVGAALKDLRGRSGAALLRAEGLLLAAVIARARGDLNRAVQLNERAASLFEKQDRRGWWAVAVQAAIAARLEDATTSSDDLARLSEAEQELAQAGYLSGQITAALTTARLARDTGDGPTAVDAYQRCAELGRRGSALQRLQRWVALVEQADMEEDGRRVSSGARAGLQTLDDHRAAFDAIELRARAAIHGEALAGYGLKWAAKRKRPEQVWFWLERTRAAALVEAAPSTVDDQQMAEALAALRAAAARVGSLEPGAPDGPEAEQNLADAEAAVRAASWRREREVDSTAADRDQPALGRSPTYDTLQRIRADLGSTGLVQYGVADGQLAAVVITADRRAFISLGSAEAIPPSMRQTAFALRRLGRVAASQPGGRALEATGDALAGLDQQFINHGIRGGLEHCDRLVIVPPSNMIGVPWASLAGFADRELTVAPSATAWWVTSNRTIRGAGRTVAVAGPGLANAATEARQVAELYDDAEAISGPDAHCDAFADRVNGATTVHVAAHGRLRSDSPTFSSFELADGPFTVHDIQQMTEPPQRWILAACDLGSPGALSGPDLEGMVGALLGSGAGAVVAAVVPVPDEVAPKLMTPLHRHLAAGDCTAHALHRARNELDPTNPLERLTQVAFTCFGAS